ncbi:hypothetical protein R3P38DRAFT_3102895 [Favolaschia claudopus]|uniref:Protein kinase domain-containing protein n=1 Tax=Favolaschia claudopus TaxID=2862362 RepID=A0AAV9ZKS1_9AGAR
MESDDGEYEVLDSTLPGSLVTTVNVSGGVGGAGGRGRQRGGAGGNGEGPRLYFKSAVVNARNTDRLNESSNWELLLDSNFRRIPLGDLFLQHQLYVDGPNSDQVRFDQKRYSVRIVRSAKIEGRDFTVATYEGTNAEQEWKRDVEMYMDIRHENVLQLYGTTRWKNTWAVVFHGDFIPFKDFLKIYHHSAILTCYIYAYVLDDVESVRKYFYSTLKLTEVYYTLLMNRFNGRLSVDGPKRDSESADEDINIDRPKLLNRTLSSMDVLSSNNQSHIVKILTLEEYHNITYNCLAKSTGHRMISPTATPHVGGVYYDAGAGNSLQMVALPHLHSEHVKIVRFYKLSKFSSLRFDMAPSNWMRASYRASKQIPRSFFEYGFRCIPETAWLCQANHIFGRLDVKSDFHKYVVVDGIRVTVELGSSRKHCNTRPQGYLFMCPPRDFVTRPASIKLPEHPWYWSLDPSGAEKLIEEQATELGFPALRPRVEIGTYSWDEFAYSGLREFHKGKGFDPESQDVAVELKEPLFGLFSDQEHPMLEKIPLACDPDDSSSESDRFEELDYDSESEYESDLVSYKQTI